MNRIVRSSVQKVGLLTRNVAAPVTNVRAASLQPRKSIPNPVFYGSVTVGCIAYAFYGINKYAKTEERILKYADKK